MNITSQISGGEKDPALRNGQLYSIIDKYTGAKFVAKYNGGFPATFIVLYVLEGSTKTSDVWKPLDILDGNNAIAVSEYEANITIEIKTS